MLTPRTIKSNFPNLTVFAASIGVCQISSFAILATLYFVRHFVDHKVVTSYHIRQAFIFTLGSFALGVVLGVFLATRHYLDRRDTRVREEERVRIREGS